jgi:hypothetical protein
MTISLRQFLVTNPTAADNYIVPVKHFCPPPRDGVLEPQAGQFCSTVTSSLPAAR